MKKETIKRAEKTKKTMKRRVGGSYSYEKVLESYGIRDTCAVDYDRDNER